MTDRPPGALQDPSVGGVHPEGLGQLGADDQDGRRRGEPDQHRLTHQVGHHAQPQGAQHQPGDTDNQGQQGGQLHVVHRSRFGYFGQGTEGQQAGQGDRPGLQVGRRGGERSKDRRQCRGEQSDVGGQPGQFGVGHRLGDEHQGHAEASHHVGAGQPGRWWNRCPGVGGHPITLLGRPVRRSRRLGRTRGRQG